MMTCKNDNKYRTTALNADRLGVLSCSWEKEGSIIMDIRSLRAFIKRHPYINYSVRCLRGLRDKRFMNIIIEEGRNWNNIQIQEFGTNNKHVNIYLIKDFYYYTNGFFTLYIHLLERLAFAERFSLVPIVEFDERCLYYQPEGVNGVTNAFEYYFEPVSTIQLLEAKNSMNVFLSHPGHEKIMDQNDTYETETKLKKDYERNSYSVQTKLYQEYARLQRKYIHLQKHLQKEFDESLNEKLLPKTLGVHVRQTDFKTHLKNHPNFIPVEEYIEQAKHMMQAYGYEHIFLATDDLATIDFFVSEFGKAVWFYEDVYRASGEVGVHFSDIERDNHRYLLGIEVLRDMITLTACDGFLGGRSSIAICVQINKMSKNESFHHIRILDKGINMIWKQKKINQM